MYPATDVHTSPTTPTASRDLHHDATSLTNAFSIRRHPRPRHPRSPRLTIASQRRRPSAEPIHDFKRLQTRSASSSTSTTPSPTPRPRLDVAICLCKLLLHGCFTSEIGDANDELRALRKDTSGRSRKTPFGGVIDVHPNYLV